MDCPFCDAYTRVLFGRDRFGPIHFWPIHLDLGVWVSWWGPKGGAQTQKKTGPEGWGRRGPEGWRRKDGAPKGGARSTSASFFFWSSVNSTSANFWMFDFWIKQERKKEDKKKERKQFGWGNQYSPCLCESVAGLRPATPSQKHGLCSPFGFQQVFMWSIAGRGLGFRF